MGQDLESLRIFLTQHFIAERFCLQADQLFTLEPIFLGLVGLLALDRLDLIVSVHLHSLGLLTDGVVHFEAGVRNDLASDLL